MRVIKPGFSEAKDGAFSVLTFVLQQPEKFIPLVGKASDVGKEDSR